MLPFSPSDITSLKLVFETTPLPSFRSSDPGEQWRLVPNPLLTMDEFLEGKADKWRVEDAWFDVLELVFWCFSFVAHWKSSHGSFGVV